MNLLFWTENLVDVDASRVEGKCVVLPFDQVLITIILNLAEKNVCVVTCKFLNM